MVEKVFIFQVHAGIDRAAAHQEFATTRKEIASLFPVEPFDESKVKLGNLKKPEAKQKRIDDAKKRHDEKVAGVEKEANEAMQQAWAHLLSQKPVEVLAISFSQNNPETGQMPGGAVVFPQDERHSERDLLAATWTNFNNMVAEHCAFVGFDIKQVQVPFLLQRSWLLDVNVPEWIYSPQGEWPTFFVDMADLCSFGHQPPPPLGSVCEQYGIDYVVPEDFDVKIFGTPAEQAEAIAMADQQSQALWKLAKKIQLLDVKES